MTSPRAGEVLPLGRTVSVAPDPLTLFAQLTSAAPADTLLLESLDATTKHPERSFLIPRCSLRAECRDRRVTFSALTPNGQRALDHLATALEAQASAVTRPEAATLVAEYPPPPHSASEEQRLRAPSPFDALRALAHSWTLLPGPLEPSLLCAGVFAYDMLECFEELPGGQDDPLGFPEFVFWLPETILVIEHRKRTTTAITLVHGGAGADASYAEAAGRIEALSARLQGPLARASAAPPPPAATVDADIGDAQFAELVDSLKARIVSGDVFQIVPSRTFTAPCPDPLAAYTRLRALNPSPYMFLVRGPEHTVFGASPETCVKVSGSPRTVEIRPIAGTARRGRRADGSPDLDLDGRLEAELRLDEKELAEHMMLVDLARNDVARVSKPGTRYVPGLLTVDRYSHVMHLVSYVAGELRDDLDALHAYAAGMNMGTLVGAPKLRAAQILREREATRRGPYGGAVGYLTHGGELDTAIVIRSATVKDGVAYVRAGAGVVYDSVPASEARETRSKAQAVLKALGGLVTSVLFLDNFDSFSFNLVDEFHKRGCSVSVWRNDLSAERALELALALPAPRLIVLSPGPGRPEDAGCCVELIRLARGRVPILGVCLGHQAMIHALGGAVSGAGEIVHGKASKIDHDQQGVFAGLPTPLTVGRYHSLIGTEIPPALTVRATRGELIMAVESEAERLVGLQFHPESILTPQGGILLQSILEWAAAWPGDEPCESS